MGVVKYKLFILTVKGATMTWFKCLVDDSIDSWRTLRGIWITHQDKETST